MIENNYTLILYERDGNEVKKITNRYREFHEAMFAFYALFIEYDRAVVTSFCNGYTEVIAAYENGKFTIYYTKQNVLEKGELKMFFVTVAIYPDERVYEYTSLSAALTDFFKLCEVHGVYEDAIHINIDGDKIVEVYGSDRVTDAIVTLTERKWN